MTEESDHSNTLGESLPETAPQSDAAGERRIGPYRLMQRLGEGGMGEVWLAEQTTPVRRRVALKIVRRGMTGKQAHARFEAEKQALALMDHPAIAKIYDAGLTPRGRPYFAMEYVPGIPITEHCDRQRLTNRERLRLFQQVCEGVQHAHQKAVIHRDLKPSNVLVAMRDGSPAPKIIDFGVAKALEHKLTDLTMHTQHGVLIGTPAYMSPEQAEMSGQGIDTRTDVYSLGMMLYELLVGALPFEKEELLRAGLAAIAQWIRDTEPPKPSSRFSTLGDSSTISARNRRTETAALRRELTGDLDWITLRALEKDRSRRYGSPHDLAADIQRYLDDQPVLASPPSWVYKAGKFVKRHRWGVSAAALGTLLLGAFAVTMAVQARRVAAERDVARQAESDLRSVVEFQAGMLSATDPEQMGRRLMADLTGRVEAAFRERGASQEDAAARVADLRRLIGGVNSTDLALDVIDENVLARSIEELEKSFGDRPAIDARLRETIGSTYVTLGRYDRAQPQLERAWEIRRDLLGAQHPLTLATAARVANVYRYQGRFPEAEALFHSSLEHSRRVLGDRHPETVKTMNSLAVLYKTSGQYDEAERLYLEVVDAHRIARGADDPATLSARTSLANLYSAQGRYSEAEPIYLETLDDQRRVIGSDHADTLGTLANLCVLLKNQGRYDEAEQLYLETLEVYERVLGKDHPDTLLSMNNLAILYKRQKRFDEAERLQRLTLEAQRRVLGEDHPDTLNSMNNLAELYRLMGRHEEAEPLYRDSLDEQRRVLGTDHRDTLISLMNLGNFLATRSRFAEAEPVLLEALAVQERVLGEDHPDTGITVHNLGCLNRDLGRYVPSASFFERAQEIWVERLGPDHPHVAENLRQWARLARKTGDEAEARRMEARAEAIAAK